MELTRRDLFKGTLGLVGILVGVPQIANSHGKNDLDAFREYAKKIYDGAERCNCGKSSSVFEGLVEKKKVSVVIEQYGGVYELEMIVSEPKLKKFTRFTDYGIKGHLESYRDMAYTGEYGSGEKVDPMLYEKFLGKVIDNLKHKGKLKFKKIKECD